jgi:hypothetical protein
MTTNPSKNSKHRGGRTGFLPSKVFAFQKLQQENKLELRPTKLLWFGYCFWVVSAHPSWYVHLTLNTTTVFGTKFHTNIFPSWYHARVSRHCHQCHDNFNTKLRPQNIVFASEDLVPDYAIKQESILPLQQRRNGHVPDNDFFS